MLYVRKALECYLQNAVGKHHFSFSDLCNMGQLESIKIERKLKFILFWAFLWSDYRHWEATVLFIQSCKLPTNWINPEESELQRSLKPL